MRTGSAVYVDRRHCCRQGFDLQTPMVNIPRMVNKADEAALLLQHTQDKIVVIDEEGVFQFVNEAVDPLLGYEPESLVGEPAFEYIHPEDRNQAQRTFESVLEQPEPTTESVRYRFRDRDGKWVWFESRFSNVTDEALDGYVVSSRDITAEIEAQRDQATAEAHLVEVTDAITDVVWMFSADWDELLFMNPAYESMYGQPVETLKGNPTTFLEQVHPDDRDHVQQAMERLSSGEPVDIEYRVNPDHDYDTFVWVQGQPIFDEDGEVIRIAGFSRDVTDRKRRERQLVVMDTLLRHNLRNDLSIVIGQADLIVTDADEPIAGRAEIIRNEAEELLKSAEKQRSIIELLTERQTPTVIDLDKHLEHVVEAARTRHPAVTIELEVVKACSVVALPELGAAVAELIDNAVEHHPEGSPAVTITVTNTEHHCHVEVRDTCPQIPQEEYEVLTGDREMNNIYHGSGLGLWLVYWAVDLSDGLITFEHTEQGNAITLSFPRDQSSPRDSEHVAEPTGDTN